MIPPGAAEAATNELAAAAKAVVTETGDVVGEIAQRVEAGDYDASAMVDAVARLSFIALAGGVSLMKVAMTAAQACGAPGAPTGVDHEQTVEPTTVDRDLVIDPPFSRGGTTEVIPPGRVTLVPSKLLAGTTTFVVRVDPTGLPTGLYSGGVSDGAGSVVAYVDLLL